MLSDQSNQSIFNLAVDEDLKYNFKEIAKWARFLAIVGFVMLGLMILGAIGLSFSNLLGTNGVAIVFVYIIFAGIFVYPVVTLLKFGKGMKDAVRNNDQQKMNNSVRNLKYCFQYIGISTILLISLYAIIILILIITNITNL